MERPGHAVGTHFPRFREPRLVLLRGEVETDEKAEQTVGDVGRGRLVRHHRIERPGIVRLAQYKTPAVSSYLWHLPDERLCRRRYLVLIANGIVRHAAAAECRGQRNENDAGVKTTPHHLTYTCSIFQRMRCAITLGRTLPKRSLTGNLTFRIGSHTNQPCSFQMVWISFQIAL